MIEINHLSFSYEEKGKRVLDDIHLKIERGSFTGIIGPSGAGKTTLTMALNGIVPHFYSQGAFYGEVKVAGKDTVESTCHQLAQTIGSVLQDPEVQMLTGKVEDEIAFALENQALAPELIEERITESLALCGISSLRNYKTSQLSGGQMQRVAIAAAVAQKPEILVLDEPTSELDPVGSQRIFETLKMLNEKFGMTIIIVEQKVMLLAKYCQRMIVMNHGKVVIDGKIRDVLEQYRVLEQLGINCPRVAKVAALLKEEGIYQGKMPVNVDETCEMIESL